MLENTSDAKVIVFDLDKFATYIVSNNIDHDVTRKATTSVYTYHYWTENILCYTNIVSLICNLYVFHIPDSHYLLLHDYNDIRSEIPPMCAPQRNTQKLHSHSTYESNARKLYCLISDCNAIPHARARIPHIFVGSLAAVRLITKRIYLLIIHHYIYPQYAAKRLIGVQREEREGEEWGRWWWWMEIATRRFEKTGWR